MNFILKPSLEHIALVKVAAVLWNQPGIRALVVEFSNSPLFSQVDMEQLFFVPQPQPPNERKVKWQTVEDKVIEKVPQLMIPISLKDKMLGYIQSVGLQILKWMDFHLRKCHFNLDLPHEFCWTSQGIIDKRKTAEMLIRDYSIDVTMRYKLACIYCLEDDILKLWNELSENDRKYFYSEGDPSEVLEQKLEVLWTYSIKGETAKICNIAQRKLNIRCSFYSYALWCGIISGNKAAVEHFLPKLNQKINPLLKASFKAAKVRRCRYLQTTDPPKEYHSEVLLFLLSKMSSEQQIEIFKRHPFEVLISLLDWPWQNFFVETANHLLKFLHKRSYDGLIKLSVYKIILGYNDYNYQKVFEELWQQIPNICKSYIINNPCIVGLVLLLLKVKDKENIKLVFQGASLTEKNKLIFGYTGQCICVDMINYDEWHLVKFFVQHCISSKNEMIKFKVEFKNHIQTFEQQYPEKDYPKLKDKLDVFFRLLDNFVCIYDKRKFADEGDNSLSKKLRSVEFQDITHSVTK